MLTLHDLREKKGVTQTVVADLIGTTRQTYSRIEQGEVDLSLGQAVKLAEYYDITINQLLPGDVQTIAPSEFYWDKYVQIIKNMIHYGSGSDGKITKTKLAKLCYLLDFTRYYNHLDSVTGLQYRRLPQGPVADAYFSVLDNLEAEESIKLEYKKSAHMISNIGSVKNNLLSSGELTLLKKIAKKRKAASTKDIVDFTHEQMPWLMCNDKEIIPYSFITQEDPEHVF